MSLNKLDAGYDRIDRVKKELTRHADAGAHLLVSASEIHRMNPFHDIVLETLYLSPEPSDKDVYLGQKATYYDGKLKTPAQFRISKQGLMRLWSAAGGVFTQSRILEDTVGGGGGHNKVVAFAEGVIKKMDGTSHPNSGTYNLDLDQIKTNLIAQYTQKCEKWQKSDKEKQNYIDFSVDRDYRQKRTFRIQLAESGAQNRVIRTLLNLKSNYTKEELEKPFVALRLRIYLDYEDPLVKKLLVPMALNAMIGIYGSASPPQIGHVEPTEEIMDAEIEQLDYVPDNAQNGTVPDIEPQTDEVPDDFYLADDKDQIETLITMMRRSGYQGQVTEENVRNMSLGRRGQFYEHLKSLTKEPDDIQF